MKWTTQIDTSTIQPLHQGSESIMENEAEEENVPKDWNIFLEILSSIYDREMQPLYLNSLITEKKNLV